MIAIDRRQMWLARVVLVLAVLVLILIKVVGIGETPVSDEGETVVYGAPIGLMIVQAVLGVAAGILAVVFWMQRAVFFRVMAFVLLATGITTLLFVPAVLNQYQRLEVRPDGFTLRDGMWYRPNVYEVQFDGLVYMSVEREEGESDYVLASYRGSEGERTEVRISDLVKRALPTIFQRAAAHGVLIGEIDGWQIPPPLMSEADRRIFDR